MLIEEEAAVKKKAVHDLRQHMAALKGRFWEQIKTHTGCRVF